MTSEGGVDFKCEKMLSFVDEMSIINIYKMRSFVDQSICSIVKIPPLLVPYDCLLFFYCLFWLTKWINDKPSGSGWTLMQLHTVKCHTAPCGPNGRRTETQGSDLGVWPWLGTPPAGGRQPGTTFSFACCMPYEYACMVVIVALPPAVSGMFKFPRFVSQIRPCGLV